MQQDQARAELPEAHQAASSSRQQVHVWELLSGPSTTQALSHLTCLLLKPERESQRDAISDYTTQTGARTS